MSRTISRKLKHVGDGEIGGIVKDDGGLRMFSTGATRDTAAGKLDFEGFLSPIVIERFGEYMNQHRVQSDGSLRDSDNWQRGIPKDVYIKSAFRHFMSWWKQHRGYGVGGDGYVLEDSLCALLFNVQGYLHVLLKAKLEEAEK